MSRVPFRSMTSRRRRSADPLLEEVLEASHLAEAKAAESDRAKRSRNRRGLRPRRNGPATLQEWTQDVPRPWWIGPPHICWAEPFCQTVFIDPKPPHRKRYVCDCNCGCLAVLENQPPCCRKCWHGVCHVSSQKKGYHTLSRLRRR